MTEFLQSVWDAVHPFQVLWFIFCLAVIYSFGTLAIFQFRIGKPHVAAMALSYTLIVGCQLVSGNPYDDNRKWVLVAALVLGIVGLVNYWARILAERGAELHD